MIREVPEHAQAGQDVFEDGKGYTAQQWQE
jgi:hypothetical protein